MKRIVQLICILLISPALSFAQGQKELPHKVFLLAGQSNMDGCGRSEELPDNYKTHPDNVITWDNKKMTWVPLGEDSFAASRKQQFRPEVAFSHALSEEFPNYTIAIIKTSAGGTKLYSHWTPGKKMYNRFMSNIENAISQLNNKGIKYEICGMLWMQGESDSETIEMANAYEANLILLVNDIREKTHKPGLTFVMGRISKSLLKETPWNFDQTEIVQKAQERVAKSDNNVHIINTDTLTTLKDNTHFETEAQLTLGSKMADIMIKELNRPSYMPDIK